LESQIIQHICPDCHRWAEIGVIEVEDEYFDEYGNLHGRVLCECGWDGTWHEMTIIS